MKHSRLSGAIASRSDMLRANCSVIVRSRPPPSSGTVLPVSPALMIPELSRIVTGPRSAPQNTTSVASGSGPASCSRWCSGVPVQRALPTPPMKNGGPLLPEHSSVYSTVRRGRACRSASVSGRGRRARPSIRSR
jgi:hypothetical protein